MERERSQGGILAGGDFRPFFGRKYNRLPLDGETRITLLLRKGALSSFPCLPGEGKVEVKGDHPPCRIQGQRPWPRRIIQPTVAVGLPGYQQTTATKRKSNS